jgi:hypothetical protein
MGKAPEVRRHKFTHDQKLDQSPAMRRFVGDDDEYTEESGSSYQPLRSKVS